jgi:hypothetical protein
VRPDALVFRGALSLEQPIVWLIEGRTRDRDIDAHG